MPYTAFASKKGKAITARLIVRRVRDLNRKAAAGQDELFACWRYHASLRGPDQRPPGSPAIGLVSRERRLAHLRGHVP